MGSLTIAKDGSVVYRRAISYAQIDGTANKPLTTASQFRIGSVTKVFTAAMILQLVEEGRLKRPINSTNLSSRFRTSKESQSGKWGHQSVARLCMCYNLASGFCGIVTADE
jgi:hypothetical protein